MPLLFTVSSPVRSLFVRFGVTQSGTVVRPLPFCISGTHQSVLLVMVQSALVEISSTASRCASFHTNSSVERLSFFESLSSSWPEQAANATTIIR